MRLSRSNQTFGFVGLFIAAIGLVYILNGGRRTSMIQAIILICSGSSLFLIAFINIIVDQITLLRWHYFNPLRHWSKERKSSIFNFKG